MKSTLSLLFLILLLIPWKIKAQAFTKYYDHYWNETTTDNKKYKKVQTMKEGKTVVETIRLPERFLMEVRSYRDSDKKVLEGYVADYYDNGLKSSEGFYEDDYPTGTWKTYYENGELESVYITDGIDKKYLEYYEKSGIQVLKYGNGIIRNIEEDGLKNRTIEIKDSTLVSNYFFFKSNSTDTFHNHLDIPPKYAKGGLNTFYQCLYSNVHYPLGAQKYFIQGKVLIEFKVMKNGEMKNINLLKGVHDALDNEALSAFSRCRGKWEPGIHKNKAVNSVLVAPVVFAAY